MNTGGLETIARLSGREQLFIAASKGKPMETAPDKIAALADAVRALDGAGAARALIGGIAVGIRSGIPRATIDTDVAVRSTVPRDQLIAAFIGAGFAHLGTYAHSINFRHSSGEPVQIALDPEFDSMIDRAETMDLVGVRVPVVTTADLIAMKERAASDPGRRLSKRLRDQADVALLRGDVPGPNEGW